jgi:hypothetical protein
VTEERALEGLIFSLRVPQNPLGALRPA